MAGILFFWGLGSFVFFKVALDANFYRDISVVAAILLGVMIAISVFVSAFFYATRIGVHLARVRFGKPSNFFGSALIVWLLTALANILVGKAIVFGFSKSFNGELGGELLFKSRSYTDEGLLFVAFIAIPITIHFLTILFSANAQTKAVQNLDMDTE